MYDGPAFIRELSIDNFRCFSAETINLAVPNGSLGSGLTLFVGNNGTGKTSALEALDYLFGGRYKAENKLSIKDFNDFVKPISIAGKTDRFSIKSELEYYKGKYFNCVGLKFSAEPRDRKQPGKLLSSTISAKSHFSLDENAYYNESDGQPHLQTRTGDTKNVDPRELTLDTGKVGPNGVNVFYFDKNRARHLVSGTYRTTFDAICDDLNWRYQKKLREEEASADYASKVTKEVFVWALDTAQKGTGAKLSEQFSDFFDNAHFKNLRLELLSLLEPFSSAFLAVRAEDQIQQVTTRSLGSGVELVLALLLQRLLSDTAKGDKILLIDEPEMHLHPTAQKKLADLLLEEAKTSQIVVSSHSPYLLQRLVKFGTTNVFSSTATGGIEVEQQAGGGLFPWSPSFGEVNFKAFAMPTVDFHNELYGYLQDKHNLLKCEDVDRFLSGKGIPSDHTWVRAGKSQTVSECTYVRHCIHHPENTSNPTYNEAKLDVSTKKLISAL
ncbi:RecF/RecN/SMC N-terminal domain-containing protein [Rhizobium leguminosarum bv. trifolii WSM597]|uniref:RecF/RecN/SMC N-terminal domain-containing protein n=1 Tax=Rhizobium leguminosarum bv. trifolii WSM597 TaxID=754764 RepID=I9NLY7_RHILT|nr:AAA family ATPase [Rhizobium leguminosarum]EJB07812.1 RecF/RecN/SMC N-terminal domain-containing protein [Rhizobium leguminosarum bv. trifolii WSM597]